MQLRIRGKVSAWWLILLLAILASGLFLFVKGYNQLTNDDLSGVPTLGSSMVFLAGAAVMTDTCIRNYLDFYADYFQVTFSFEKVKIPYSEVLSMSETSNILASPAASLDRVILKYGFDELMISVDDKDLLFSEMTRRNPNIKIYRKNK